MSLHENCILVSYSFGMPPKTRQAKEASIETSRRHNAQEEQGNFIKHLFLKKDVQPLTLIRSRIINTIDEMTLPYDKSYRLIPTEKYFEFSEYIANASTEFDVARTDFLRKYDDCLANAKQALGELFDPHDYPYPQELSERIFFRLDATVLPPDNAFDGLAGLSEEEIENLKAQAAENQKVKIEKSMSHLLERLVDSLRRAVVRLSVEDAIFRNTLIENIDTALVSIEGLMSVSNNTRLQGIVEEVREMVNGVSPEALRNDSELREETAVKTQKLLDNVGEFF